MPTSSGCRDIELADAALSAAVAAGASYADLRIHGITTEIVQLRDGELETAVVNREIGLAVRVIVDGTWGFASHAELIPDVAAETARRAVQVATTLAPLNAERIELAAEPVYSDVSWVSDYRVDPFAVGVADKIARAGGVLRAAAGRRRRRPRVGRPACGEGADVLRRHVRLVDHAAAGAGAADVGGRHRRRRGGHVRHHAHAGAADGAGLGVRRGRRHVELDRRAGAAAVAARREGQGAERDGGTDRPGDRPVQPLADDSRIDRPRHRVRPGDRLRGRLCGHLVRHAGQARHHALRIAGDERDRRPHGRIRVGHCGFRRRGRAGAELGSGARRHLRRLSAGPGVRPAAGCGAVQRLLVRRLAAPRADPADGQRVAAARAPTS